MTPEEKEQKEKIERTTFVLGIFSASIIGFVLNLYANIYYDVFVTGDKQFGKMSEAGIIFPTFALIFTIGFLQFLIYDYKNELNLNRPFFDRFFYYFDKVFWVGRMAAKFDKVYDVFIKWFIWTIIGYWLYRQLGWAPTGIWVTLVLIWTIGKLIYKRKHGK